MNNNCDEQKITTILRILDSAISKFYEHDISLLTNGHGYRCGMEQACAFRIGFYFCNIIQDSDLNLYNVDMEYNKDNFEPKDGRKRPDLIVHKRWDNDDNLLIVEFKYINHSNIEGDIEKLKIFTNNCGKYRYKIGTLVQLGRTPGCVKKSYFKYGEKWERGTGDE